MGPNHETLSYELLNHSSPSHLCRLLSCSMTWTDQGQWNHTSCTQLSLHLVRVWLRAMRTSVHRNKSFSPKRKEPAKCYNRKKKSEKRRQNFLHDRILSAHEPTIILLKDYRSTVLSLFPLPFALLFRGMKTKWQPKYRTGRTLKYMGNAD